MGRQVKRNNLWLMLRKLRRMVDYPLTFDILRRKEQARAATKFHDKPKSKPKFYFGISFFTKLAYMPAMAIEVKESRSQIRKTCYGFRDKNTGERVYLRIDPGSVVEFRDSPTGYLIGSRYFIPGLDRMKPPRWDKVERKMTGLLRSQGIIVSKAMADRYRAKLKRKAKFYNKFLELFREHNDHKALYHRDYGRAYARKKSGKTKQKVS